MPAPVRPEVHHPGYGPPQAISPAPVAQTKTLPAPPQASAVAKPVVAPKPAPAPTSKLKAALAKRAKMLTVLAVGLITYGGYRFYEFRQPYEWSGTVEAKIVSVGSRTGGRVKEVLVTEGQDVKAGAILAILEPGEFEANKAIAEGELEAAEAAYEKLANGARPEELAQANARVAEARAAAMKEGGRAIQEQRDFSRAQTLFTGGAISAAEHEMKGGAARMSLGAAAQAGARAKEAEAALKLLTGGTRPEDLRVAKANVAVAKAKLASAVTNIGELAIRAPRDSRVESITVRPGDILGPNATAARVLERHELYVRIYVPETQIGKLRIGQEVPITVDSFSKRQFKGRVEHINEVGEFTPSRLVTTEDRANEVFGARVSLVEGTDDLKAGMAAFIHVPKR
ncbi:efflux RND transporter periplasmic adaptor subunit [soil metagenome]